MGKYINDVIEVDKIKPRQFNLITGGCGSGKTTFILEDLLKHFPDVKPEQMMVVTSRSITAHQMEYDHSNVTRYNNEDVDIITYWSDADREVSNPGIRVMTYDKIIDILRSQNYWGIQVIGNVRILVFDECHTLFTDTFIKEIESVAIWLREAIMGRGDLIVVGITATPTSMEYVNARQNRLPIVHVMPETLITYKAKRMICTNFAGAFELLQTKELPGRNIMMCGRIEECKIIYELISDSGVVVSQSRNGITESSNQFIYGRRNYLYLEYEDYMDIIRSYVGEHSDIPGGVYTNGGYRTLNTLVTTSTFREGFNLREDSGVRNVFIVATDEMQITQFLGRCRYNVDNLIIVVPPRNITNNTCCGYFTNQAESFMHFVAGWDTEWFDSVSQLVDGDVPSVEFYGSILDKFSDSAGYTALRNKILAKHMMRSIGHLISTEDNPVYIWRGNHDDEIRRAAYDCGMFRGNHVCYDKITLNKVIGMLQQCGYRVEVHPKLPDGTRRRCYCIYAD